MLHNLIDVKWNAMWIRKITQYHKIATVLFFLFSSLSIFAFHCGRLLSLYIDFIECSYQRTTCIHLNFCVYDCVSVRLSLAHMVCVHVYACDVVWCWCFQSCVTDIYSKMQRKWLVICFIKWAVFPFLRQKVTFSNRQT